MSAKLRGCAKQIAQVGSSVRCFLFESVELDSTATARFWLGFAREFDEIGVGVEAGAGVTDDEEDGEDVCNEEYCSGVVLNTALQNQQNELSAARAIPHEVHFVGTGT